MYLKLRTPLAGYVYHQACTKMGGEDNLKASIAKGDTTVGKSECGKHTMYFLPQACFGKEVSVTKEDEVQREKETTREAAAGFQDIFDDWGFGLTDDGKGPRVQDFVGGFPKLYCIFGVSTKAMLLLDTKRFIFHI